MGIMSDKKPIDELSFNDDIFYYEEHTWARVEGEKVRVGISDYAQDQLGDIIFIQLPEVDAEFQKGDVFGQAESAKTVSELYMPVGGKIVEINEELENDPELVNNSPYGDGWMVVIEPDDLKEVDALLTKDKYINLLK
jgi:glycine cleavage system H protein